MVAVKDNLLRFTPEGYFQWEGEQKVRNEYLTVAMNQIIGRLSIIKVEIRSSFKV